MIPTSRLDEILEDPVSFALLKVIAQDLSGPRATSPTLVDSCRALGLTRDSASLAVRVIQERDELDRAIREVARREAGCNKMEAELAAAWPSVAESDEG